GGRRALAPRAVPVRSGVSPALAAARPARRAGVVRLGQSPSRVLRAPAARGAGARQRLAGRRLRARAHARRPAAPGDRRRRCGARARRPERAGCPPARAARRVARLLPAADRRGVRVLRAGDASHLAQAAAPGRRAPERAARVGGAGRPGDPPAVTAALWLRQELETLGARGVLQPLIEADEIVVRGVPVGPHAYRRLLL